MGACHSQMHIPTLQYINMPPFNSQFNVLCFFVASTVIKYLLLIIILNL